jgi:acyl-[acyl-carrier-protein]-phospholipid O-acyltransferase/long-chain-fatty-acid--[acyl-carrier-protein] ligase
MRAAIDQIEQGEVVCLFPEGELSRSGMLLRLRRGYELIARGAKYPVVPVWMDQLWGGVFSFEGGKFFFNWPKPLPYLVTIAFGEPIPHADAGIRPPHSPTPVRVSTVFGAADAKAISLQSCSRSAVCYAEAP